jgi:hypothetical protein
MALLTVSGRDQASFLLEGFQNGVPIYNTGRETFPFHGPHSCVHLYSRASQVRQIIDVNSHLHGLTADLGAVFSIEWQEFSPQGESL